jgi:hypothetical protein
MAGHIKLDRKILTWEWYKDTNVFRVFTHLLLTANYKEGKWQGNTIGRGQLITGLDKMAESTGLSVMQVRTCFDKLKLTGEITVNVTNKFRLVTIVKYDTYQSYAEQSNKQTNIQIEDEIASEITSQQQTDNKQVTANNNNNTINTKNTSKNTAPPTIDEFLEYCKTLVNGKYQSYEFSFKAKYEAWVDNKWKDGNNSAIKNWKSKIKNTLPYLRPMPVDTTFKPSVVVEKTKEELEREVEDWLNS